MKGRASKPFVAHCRGVYLPRAETFLYAFLSSAQRFTPLVICEQIINREQFPITHLEILPRLSWPFRLYGAIMRLVSPGHFWIACSSRRVLEKYRPVVIHAHFGPMGVFLMPVARALKVPLVVSFYGFDQEYSALAAEFPQWGLFDKQRYWQKAYERLFSEAAAVIAFGERACDIVVSLGCPAEKVHDIHSGIVPEDRPFRYTPLPEAGEPVVIWMLNRLVPKKGVSIALQAFAKISGSFSHVVLRIGGDGPLRDSLQHQAEALGIAHRVTWLGSLSYHEAQREFDAAHIFMTPSVVVPGDAEGGINTTVIDALAQGVPTIATRESGSQLIVHEKTGLMVEPGDVDELAQALTVLLTNENKRKTYAREGRALIEKDFNQRIQTEKMEALYDAVITERRTV